ncbi:MAG: hypothetical protein VCC04_08265, partial [Myxococcota bacterium]
GTSWMATQRTWGVDALVGLVTGLLAVSAAGAATASEIVDLRIGAHEEFTRVVFELDRPTGYRIERASPKPGVSELVISIDATSIPRNVQAQNALISRVKITPRGKGALAEIRLARDGLRLKEMILSSPPRIVLDILSSPSAKKSTSRTAAVAAKSTAKETPAAKKKAAVQKSKKQKSKKKKAAATPKPDSAAKPKTPKPPAEKEAAVVVRTSPSAEPTPGVKLLKPRRMVVEPKLARAADPKEPMGGDLAVLELEAEEVVRVPSPAPGREQQVLENLKSPSEEEESGSGALWATVIGIVAMSIVLMAMRRRRAVGRPDELDEGVEVGGASADADNPFSNRAASASLNPFGSEEDRADEAMPNIELGLADMDEDSEKEAAPVDGPFTAADPAVHGRSAGSGMSGINDEMQRLAGDFQRKAESLERRLEEATEARERLERQVAAQTEELRVQRAAIARTQRAVRNMNRPDEDGATEPTPRDS